jgi:hypothetical protein
MKEQTKCKIAIQWNIVLQNKREWIHLQIITWINHENIILNKISYKHQELCDLYEIQENCEAKPQLSTSLVWEVPKKLLNPPSVCVCVCEDSS